MRVLSIHRPHLPVTIANASPNRRFLSADPKEATIAKSTGSLQYGLDIDFGQTRSITSVFVGFTNVPIGWTVEIFGSIAADGSSSFVIDGFPLAMRSRVSGMAHFYAPLIGAPVSTRYVYVRFTRPSNIADTAITVGTVATGAQSFRPTWGQEWGAGRSIFDTGTADRLFGGGFGIDEGARVPGYAWTLGDLQPTEVDALYDLIIQVGQTRSILVIEDDDNTAGLYERTHWGLFQKLDTYERLDPLNTKWALQIGDWA